MDVIVPEPPRMEHDVGPRAGGLYQRAIADQLSWLVAQEKGRKSA